MLTNNKPGKKRACIRNVFLHFSLSRFILAWLSAFCRLHRIKNLNNYNHFVSLNSFWVWFLRCIFFSFKIPMLGFSLFTVVVVVVAFFVRLFFSLSLSKQMTVPRAARNVYAQFFFSWQNTIRIRYSLQYIHTIQIIALNWERKKKLLILWNLCFVHSKLCLDFRFVCVFLATSSCHQH